MCSYLYRYGRIAVQLHSSAVEQYLYYYRNVHLPCVVAQFGALDSLHLEMYLASRSTLEKVLVTRSKQ